MCTEDRPGRKLKDSPTRLGWAIGRTRLARAAGLARTETHGIHCLKGVKPVEKDWDGGGITSASAGLGGMSPA
jgi:hypothetical protein